MIIFCTCLDLLLGGGGLRTPTTPVREGSIEVRSSLRSGVASRCRSYPFEIIVRNCRPPPAPQFVPCFDHEVAGLAVQAASRYGVRVLSNHLGVFPRGLGPPHLSSMSRPGRWRARFGALRPWANGVSAVACEVIGLFLRQSTFFFVQLWRSVGLVFRVFFAAAAPVSLARF